MKYFYIHGFNSGPDSRSRHELEKVLEREIISFQNDYSRAFPECLSNLENLIGTYCGQNEACVLGTSLGGFYALQLRLPQIVCVTAWNPVIWPALQLKQFIGENTRFTDGTRWTFSSESCLSYARAADPRQWHNFYEMKLAEDRNMDPEKKPPARTVVFGDHDELLDSSLGREYWSGHAPIKVVSSGHGIEDFSHAREILKDFI